MKYSIFSLIMIVLFVCPALAVGEIQDGLCKVYTGENYEFLDIVVMHFQGRRDGVAMQFFENGEVQKIAWYNQGVLHGTFESFWSNGRTKSFQEYRKGVPDGRVQNYDRNGDPQVKLSYAQGQLNGPGYYYENGVRQEKVEYHKGRTVSSNE